MRWAVLVVFVAGCYSTRFGTIPGDRQHARAEIAQRAKEAGLRSTDESDSDGEYVGPSLGPSMAWAPSSSEDVHYKVHLSPGPTGTLAEVRADATDLSRLVPDGHTFDTFGSPLDRSPLGRLAIESAVDLGGVWGPRGAYARSDATLRLGGRLFLDSPTSDPALKSQVGLAILGGAGLAVESTGKKLLRADLTLSASFQQVAQVALDRRIATSPLRASLTAAFLQSTSDSGRSVELQLAIPFPKVRIGPYVRAGYEWGDATAPRGFTISTGYTAPPDAWAAFLLATAIDGAVLYGTWYLTCRDGCGPR
ncbi:MAG TPA: hypothetical protein VGM90_34580 [Kofleriaceae bacterium]